MSYEFNAFINGKVTKIFFNMPLMSEDNMTKIIHNHKYTEFHIVYGGSLKAFIENSEYIISSGSVYAVPAGLYHCYIEAEPNTLVAAFQTDAGLTDFEERSISNAVIKEFIGLLENNAFSNDCSALSGLFSFVAASFFTPVKPEETKDYATVIYEFISKNYNQRVQLSELAKKIYLSNKQTERWVKKYTGYTFKKAVMNYRIKVADFLEKNTDMSQTEISEYVGYSDYSGYWKAKKAFKDNGIQQK